jgi:ParB/RepB/Spo0J family partition protein
MSETNTEMEIQKTTKNDLLSIDPRNIIIEDDFNVRADYGNIDELAKSIVEFGQLEPIMVTKKRGTDQYILTDGHRRMKAILKAIEKGHPIKYVKAFITSGNIEDRIFAMVITGIGKKPLNNLEEGEAYKRLKAYGYEVKDIANKVGKSLPHIYNMLKLADAPQQVKKYIINGDISGNTVVSLLKDVKTADDLIRVVEEAVLASEIEHEQDEKAGKKTTKKKKATARHTGVLTPMKKLEAALDIAVDKGYENIQLLHEIVTKLGNKESKPEQIAKLFK